jgi:hypothetical protein
MSLIYRSRDMAVGSGLGIHIKDAYRFLMQNWREGDKICLLGFSRGAYTVRCLAGMLHKVGLLPASNGAQVNFAYDFYKDDSEDGWKMSAEFKKTFCTDVNVYFVGLWDCVASVGFLPRKLPFSKSPTNSIHYFRHAMALDEHRAKFKVCQWQHTDPDLQRRATFDNTPQAQISRGFKKTGVLKLLGKGKPATVPLNGNAHTNGHSNGYANGFKRAHTHDSDEKKGKQDELEREFDAYDAARRRHGTVKTDALEVWFMGGHADIGGGAVKNEERHKLAQIPLRWMLRQCFECDTGIAFDVSALCEMGMDVHTLWPSCKPISKPPTGPSPDLFEHYEKKLFPAIQRRSIFLNFKDKKNDEDKEVFHTDHRLAHLSECTEDHFDGMSPVNDMLKIAKGWWILELWPVKIRVLCSGGEGWEKKVRMNMGRYRAIRESNPKMHWTVERMVEDGKYTVKGRTERNTSWEVVA